MKTQTFVRVRWVDYYFFSIPYISIDTITTVSYKYSYTKPNVGKTGRSVIPNFGTLHKVVSTVHTHGNYDPEYKNEEFSVGDDWWELGDIEWANMAKMNIYVATPGERLKKYTYSDRNNSNGGVTTISTAIPWDPNCPAWLRGG